MNLKPPPEQLRQPSAFGRFIRIRNPVLPATAWLIWTSGKIVKRTVLVFVLCGAAASAAQNQAIERALEAFPPGATDLVPRSARASVGEQKTIVSPRKTTPSFLDFRPPITAPSIDFSKAFTLENEKTPIQRPQRDAGNRPASSDTPASETPSSLGPGG